MRQHRLAARTAYPAHGVDQRRPLVRNVARLAGHQEPAECVPRVGDLANFREEAREVGAPDQRRVLREAQRPFEGAVDPRLLQFPRDTLRALQPPAAHADEPRRQRLVAGIDAQPDDVDRAAAPGDGDFHAVDEAHACRKRRLARFGQPAQLVVVGERPDLHAVARPRGARPRRAAAPRPTRWSGSAGRCSRREEFLDQVRHLLRAGRGAACDPHCAPLRSAGC